MSATVSGDPAIARAAVLVVIPCLDEAAMLPGLLQQLIEDGSARHIVVADGGSTDRSRAIVAEFAARHPQVSLLDNPDRIQSAGVNRAVRLFGGDCDWLVRVDAHCLYPARYVSGLIAAAQKTDAQSVVVPMETEGHGCFQRAVAAVQNSVVGTGGSPHRHVTSGRFVDHGHHAAMRIDRFCAVGGYDESFSHNEDAELDQRLLATGARIWLEPSLALVYFPRRTVASLFRQYRGYGAGRARTAMRHGNRMALRQMMPLAIAPIVLLGAISLALAAVSPWFLLGMVPVIGWGAACSLAGVALAWQARSVCVLGAGVAAMTMHLGWSIGNWKIRLLRRRPGPPPKPLTLGSHHRDMEDTADTARRGTAGIL